MRVYIDLYLFLHAMNIFCIVIMMFIIVACHTENLKSTYIIVCST